MTVGHERPVRRICAVGEAVAQIFAHERVFTFCISIHFGQIGCNTGLHGLVCQFRYFCPIFPPSPRYRSSQPAASDNFSTEFGGRLIPLPPHHCNKQANNSTGTDFIPTFPFLFE